MECLFGFVLREGDHASHCYDGIELLLAITSPSLRRFSKDCAEAT